LYNVKLFAWDGCNDVAKSGSVASHPWSCVDHSLAVFSGISKDADSGDLVIFVKAMVLNWLDERGDKGRNRVRSLDVFPQVPIKEFMVGLSSPLTVIIVGAIIDDFREFSMVGGFQVRHDVGLMWG
jgi:hypothetical protein